MKTCTKCGFVCSLEEVPQYFYKSGVSAKGEIKYHAHCKECEKKRTTSPEYIEKKKEYHQKNKGRIAEYYAEYYIKRKEEVQAKQKEWRNANRDKLRELAKRRFTRYSLFPNTITDEDIFFALAYFGNQCPNCNADITDTYTLDHHIPLFTDNSPGTVPGNMVPLCPSCNSAKNTKLPQEFYSPEVLKEIEQFLEQTRTPD